MQKTSRRLWLGVAVVAMFALSTQAQQPVPPTQPDNQTVVINFFVMTTPDSINALISIVDAQLRQGAKKIVILISSVGGETTSAFTAYNYLRGIPAEVTTFNLGNVDSAATLLYCAGKNRYSLPGTRFLIHSVSVQAPANSQLDATALQTQLALVQNQNQMISRVISTATNKKEAEIETMLQGQTILTSEQAKGWGLVQEIKDQFLEPGARLVTVNAPENQGKQPKTNFEYRTLPDFSPTTIQWPVSGISQAGTRAEPRIP
jgi:ATP-dependent Clp protease protease subunit